MHHCIYEWVYIFHEKMFLIRENQLRLPPHQSPLIGLIVLLRMVIDHKEVISTVTNPRACQLWVPHASIPHSCDPYCLCLCQTDVAKPTIKFSILCELSPLVLFYIRNKIVLSQSGCINV